MSRILSITAQASPPTIVVVWQGEGKLLAHQVVLEESKVFVDGAHTSLRGWKVRIRAAGGQHTLTLTQTDAFDALEGYVPRDGEIIAVQLHLTNPGPHTTAPFAAMVGGPPKPDQVADAVHQVGAGIQDQMQVLSDDVRSFGLGMQAMGAGMNAIGQGAQANYADVNRALSVLTAFPVEVTEGAGGAPAAPSSPRASVEREMRAVLGRTASGGGLTGILAALDRTFKSTVTDGVETWEWSPSSYAQQSDIGAGVTGRQASLARLAETASQEILALLDGLSALVPEDTVNPDEIAAYTAVFRQSWTAFVGELGADGGPRRARAGGLLQDAQAALLSLLRLLGIFGQSGPTRTNVVTDDDEAIFTNGIIISDRVKIVGDQFNAYLAAVGPPGGTAGGMDRGTTVVLLERDLDAAAELALAVYAALDSVNIGQDRREILDVNHIAGGIFVPSGLVVEDVLSWAAALPEEGRELLGTGGTLGAGAIVSRVAPLLDAVKRLITYANSDAGKLADLGLSHPRVQVPLDRLSATLADVEARASALASEAAANGSGTMSSVVPGVSPAS